MNKYWVAAGLGILVAALLTIVVVLTGENRPRGGSVKKLLIYGIPMVIIVGGVVGLYWLLDITPKKPIYPAWSKGGEADKGTAAALAAVGGGSAAVAPRAGKLDALRVYRDPDAYAEVERSKAVEFGLEKVASIVNYLLLSAAAILGFVVKAMVDMRTEWAKAGTYKAPKRPLLIGLGVGAAMCFLSICCGVMAYLYLTSVGTAEAFSIYNEMRVAVFCQFGTLAIAILALVVALASVVSELWA